MMKLKLIFKIRLLTIVGLCMLSQFTLLAENCPTIDFNSLSCGSIGSTSTYEVSNYDMIGKIEWTVEGGEIIQVGDFDISFFAQTYCGATMDWSQASNFTSISYNRSNTGSATFYNTSTNQIQTEGQSGNSLPFNINYARKIVVSWYNKVSSKRIKVKGEGLGFLGLCGKSETTKNITITPYLNNAFTLTASKTNLLCNEGVTISGAPGGGTTYNWYAPGAVIQQNWNSGIYVSNFTNDGVVSIGVVVSNQCNTVSKIIQLTVTQPDFGHVQQNGVNVDDPGTLVSLDCQGNFDLGMPWVSNNATYTWELPGTSYNNQTNTYTKTILSGKNKLNIQGHLPKGGYTDFVGKVTITGVCGAPVVRTFIIRPTLSPSVDADIYSCSNTALINVNNPNASSPINPYIASASPNGWALSWVNTPTTSLFTASNPGNYVIKINITDASGCPVTLQTNVHIGAASGNTNAGAAGWQSGVLSDNRKAPGSNIVASGGNIYFSGRDGKIYYYTFSTALQKWVINQMPGITNAAIPVAGAFTKIGVATLNNIPYLLYTEITTNKLWKIDLTTNLISDAVSPSKNVSDFMAMGNDIYAIEKGSTALIYNNGIIDNNFGSATLKAIIPGYGITYVKNNDLYSTTYGQLTFAGDVYASSDMVFYNGYLYFARGQKGSANLYRLPMPNPNSVEQITTTSNLSGVFTINPASGVIYYGVMDAGILNTIATVSSGYYKSSNIYQAYLSGSTWNFKAATTVKSGENFDMYIQSPIYSGNHVYYIGAGHNEAIGSRFELEVWNLYYENGCAPVVQRIAANDIVLEETNNVLVYPNPFNRELMVDLSTYTIDGNATSVAVEIMDATGKNVYSGILQSELASIATVDWSAGMYVVKIKHNNTLTIKKVVKY